MHYNITNHIKLDKIEKLKTGRYLYKNLKLFKLIFVECWNSIKIKQICDPLKIFLNCIK